MGPEDSDYFRARAIEERCRVRESGQSSAAAIHAELAYTYEALADRLEFRDVLIGETLQDTIRSIS